MIQGGEERESSVLGKIRSYRNAYISSYGSILKTELAYKKRC